MSATETARPVEAITEELERLYHDIDLGAVKEWRERHEGAKAIGYLPIYVARELIDAAGMLPVGLMGGRGLVEIIHGDAYFQSYICQIPRSTIELAQSGRLDCLDGFLFPSICDVIRNLSGMWKVMFPKKYVRYIDVPQNYDTKVGGAFWTGELRHLRADLEELAGHKISEFAIGNSIRRYNENRHAINALMEMREAEPWRVPAWESYLVMWAGTVLPVDEHTKIIDEYMNAAREAPRPRRDNARVVVVGSFCEQPPLGLIRTLELAGCYIVWDDFALGRRWLEGDVSEAGDPIEALSDAFLKKSTWTAARYEPNGDRGAPLIQLVKRTKSEGVVFAAPSFCDPALLDQPMLTDACDDQKVPWTAFKYAESLGQFQVIREQAGTFADSIKLWSEA